MTGRSGCYPDKRDPPAESIRLENKGETTMAKTKKRGLFDLMDELTLEQVEGGKWAVFHDDEVLALCKTEAIATFVQMAILTANLNPVEVE